MTLDEARALRVGSIACHRGELDTQADGTPVMRALRVTALYHGRTCVLVRVASISRFTWLNAECFELPPRGKRYNRYWREWLTVEERAERCPAGVVPPTVREPDLLTTAARGSE